MQASNATPRTIRGNTQPRKAKDNLPKVIVVKSRQKPNYPDLYEGYYEIEHVC